MILRLYRKTWFQLTLVSLACLTATFPLIRYGFPHGEDSAQDCSWQDAFARQFWTMDLYPRWLLSANAGFGSPALFVYGPLPFWIASLFRPFALWLSAGISPAREIAFSAVLAFILSGVGAYFWLRDSFGRRAALVGAILFVYSPYHLVADLYIRGALAESWAFAWMPFVLWFTLRLIRGERLAAVGIAIAYSCLIFSHLFTTLLFTPLPIAMALYLRAPSSRVKILGRLLGAMALGAALSAVYLLPALVHEKHVSAQRLIEQGPSNYTYAYNFVFSNGFERHPLAAAKFGWYISWLTAEMFVIAALCFCSSVRCSEKEVRHKAIFWGSVAAGSFFMMLPISKFIWEKAPLLGLIQSPWRLNTILSVATIALMALTVECFRTNRRDLRTPVAYAAFLLVLPWFAGAAWAVHRESPWIPAQHGPVSDEAVWPPDYDYLTPVWTQARPTGELGQLRVRRIASQFGGRKVIADNGKVTIAVWKPRQIRLKTEFANAGEVLVRQFYYPGWAAEAENGRIVGLATSPDGLMSLSVPAGTTDISLRFPRGPDESMGLWITVLAVLAIGCIAFAKEISNRSYVMLGFIRSSRPLPLASGPIDP